MSEHREDLPSTDDIKVLADQAAGAAPLRHTLLVPTWAVAVAGAAMIMFAVATMAATLAALSAVHQSNADRDRLQSTIAANTDVGDCRARINDEWTVALGRGTQADLALGSAFSNALLAVTKPGASDADQAAALAPLPVAIANAQSASSVIAGAEDRRVHATELCANAGG